MTNKISKQESRKRWTELQNLACEWDPIGVMDDPEWPRDEYDCVLGPVMRMLEQNATVEDIDAYLKQELVHHFGLNPVNGKEPESLAVNAKAWFEKNWKDTHV